MWRRINIFCLLYKPTIHRQAPWPIDQSNGCVKKNKHICLLYEPILQRSTLTNQSIKRLCEEEWTYYVCLMSLSYREAYWPINQSNDCVKKNKHIFLLYEPTSQCLFTSQTEPWLSPSTILPRPLTVVKTKIGYLPIKNKKTESLRLGFKMGALAKFLLYLKVKSIPWNVMLNKTSCLKSIIHTHVTFLQFSGLMGTLRFPSWK